MSFLATAYQVLIASPSDVSEQRKKVPEILNKWNTLNSAYYEVVFLPIKWETHTVPEMGDRPQAIINKQIVDNSDILVGTFWTKLGSHTGVAESGTVEEIQEFMKKDKKVMLYFSSAPVVPDSIDFDQYQKLKVFKEECQQKGLYDSYSSLEEFEEKLYNHLTSFAQSQKTKKKEIINSKNENELLVQYYLPKYCDFSSRFKAFRRDDFANSKFIHEKQGKLKELIKDISEIKLKAFSEINKEKSDGEDETHSINLSAFGGSLLTSKELSPKKRADVIQKTNNLLNIQLEDSFFNVGELMESRLSFSSPFFNNKSIEGTETEKEKGEKIQDFLRELKALEGYLEMFNYIGSYFVIPLVLRNTGQEFNESITVKLKFPKEVEILEPQDLKVPSPLVIKEFTDGILNYILRHNKDSKVQENFEYTPLPSPPILSLSQSYSEKVESLNEDYSDYINSLFNVEIYNEDEYHVFEYYYRELNPKENISFPSYILFKASETFKFSYEITSKNLPDMLTGELEYQIEN